MSENIINKSITPNDGPKTEAAKSGWLLKWTNYLKGKRTFSVTAYACDNPS